MDRETKQYILDNIGKRSIKQIAEALGIKERKIKKFLEKRGDRRDEPRNSAGGPLSKRDMLFPALSILLIVLLGFIVIISHQ